MTARQHSDGRTDGQQHGQSASDPQGFHGVTPTAMRTGAAGGQVSTAAITSGATTAVMTKVIARVAELEVLANELQATLVEKGFHSGAA